MPTMFAQAGITMALLWTSAATRALPASAPCVRTGEAQSSDPGLRPSAILSCAYGEAELARRLLSIFALPDRGLRIEAVERAFSLPQLQTSYDHRRRADYAIRLQARDGAWTAVLDFDESFFPLDAQRRPRFRPGIRPERLDPRLHGEVSLRLTLLPRLPAPRSRPCLLTMAGVLRAARRDHWQAETIVQLAADGAGNPTTVLGRKRSGARAEVDPGGCVTGIIWTQAADDKAS